MSNEFRRGLEQRHVMMLSFGGVIGTGLFLSTGYTLQQAGPVGTVISYLVGALLVYMVMKCLGALAVKHPESAAFIHMPISISVRPSVMSLPGATGSAGRSQSARRSQQAGYCFRNGFRISRSGSSA